MKNKAEVIITRAGQSEVYLPSDNILYKIVNSGGKPCTVNYNGKKVVIKPGKSRLFNHGNKGKTNNPDGRTKGPETGIYYRSIPLVIYDITAGRCDAVIEQEKKKAGFIDSE